MSDNYRKNVTTYTMANQFVGAKVFRPNSMRQVNAELELNRLLIELNCTKHKLKQFTDELQVTPEPPEINIWDYWKDWGDKNVP